MITPQDLAFKIREQAERLRKDNLPLKIASATAHTLMVKRIFVYGKTSGEGLIGIYSTKDIYINPSKTKTRNKKGLDPLKGKNGNTEFKTNPSRVRVSSYFEGWKGFREAQGLKADKVNLNYTGDMFMDFANTSNQNITSSSQFKPIFVSLNEYVAAFRNSLNTLKASGNEDHFGAVIFKLTQSEKDAFYKTANFELKRLLSI